MESTSASRAAARSARRATQLARTEARQRAKKGALPDLVSASTSGDSEGDRREWDRARIQAELFRGTRGTGARLPRHIILDREMLVQACTRRTKYKCQCDRCHRGDGANPPPDGTDPPPPDGTDPPTNGAEPTHGADPPPDGTDPPPDGTDPPPDGAGPTTWKHDTGHSWPPDLTGVHPPQSWQPEGAAEDVRDSDADDNRTRVPNLEKHIASGHNPTEATIALTLPAAPVAEPIPYEAATEQGKRQGVGSVTSSSDCTCETVPAQNINGRRPYAPRWSRTNRKPGADVYIYSNTSTTGSVSIAGQAHAAAGTPDDNGKTRTPGEARTYSTDSGQSDGNDEGWEAFYERVRLLDPRERKPTQPAQPRYLKQYVSTIRYGLNPYVDQSIDNVDEDIEAINTMLEKLSELQLDGAASPGSPGSGKAVALAREVGRTSNAINRRHVALSRALSTAANTADMYRCRIIDMEGDHLGGGIHNRTRPYMDEPVAAAVIPRTVVAVPMPPYVKVPDSPDQATDARKTRPVHRPCALHTQRSAPRTSSS